MVSERAGDKLRTPGEGGETEKEREGEGVMARLIVRVVVNGGDFEALAATVLSGCTLNGESYVGVNWVVSTLLVF